MLRLPFTYSLLGAILLPFSLSASSPVGAYWAFQTNEDPGEVYSEAVSVNTWPNGTPVFSRSGSSTGIFNNFGNSFTAHNESIWVPGKCLVWNTSASPSTGNSFEVTLDATRVEDFTVRLKYRLNGVQSSGGNVTAFSSFEYRIGSGAFTAISGVDLSLSSGSSFNNIWSADLSGLTAIEDAGMVTLRWNFPDLIQVAGKQIRLDDIEIVGQYSNRARFLSEQNYNVLFISIDDLKPMLGLYGDPVIQTPNLDRLAERGIAFSNAHCQQAICNASRVSVMTGLRVDATKTWQLETLFRDTVPDVVTLPQHFAANGYTTYGIGKIYHGPDEISQDVVNSWPDGWINNESPHKYYGIAAGAEDAGDSMASSTDAGVTDRNGSPVTDQHYTDGLNSDHAITKLADFGSDYRNNGTPFFLALGFFKPHLPFNCPIEYWNLYNQYIVNDLDLSGYTGTKEAPAGSLVFAAPFAGEPSSYSDTPNPPTTFDASRLIHGYMACISYIDTLFGEVLDALDAEGLADSTIIVVWGDHGWHLADHDGWWAKHTNYEQATRSPLIISVPGMDALETSGAVSHTPMELVDIYPTLVDLCGLPEPSQPTGLDFQGTSFLHLLENINQPWKKAAFSQYRRGYMRGDGITNTGGGMGYTLRTERYRYTEWWRTDGTEVVDGIVQNYDEKLYTTPEFVELYDYAVDPGETVNLAQDPSYSTIKADLQAMLVGGDGWSLEVVAPPSDYPDTLAEWKSRYMTAGYSESDFDPEEDPDGDQIKNLLEYALGTNPLNADIREFEFSVNNGSFVMEYNHANNRTDVNLVAVQAEDLSVSAFSNPVSTSTIGTFPNHLRKQVSVPINQLPKSFFRLEATTQ
jgi:arylsulfatase A-like enzyme